MVRGKLSSGENEKTKDDAGTEGQTLVSQNLGSWSVADVTSPTSPRPAVEHRPSQFIRKMAPKVGLNVINQLGR